MWIFYITGDLIGWKTLFFYCKFEQKLLSICVLKKKICVCVYASKWLILAKKKNENHDIEVIVNGIGKLWLNEKHIEEKLGHKTLPTNMTQYTKSTGIN